MGVTLERVQNKFACIIGELCSEPIVLSQFAIWLDLRLAEYKAKGAISLDCSGDNPDPVWMNGHRLPQQTEQKRHSQPGRYGPSTPMSKHRDVSWSRLSAERESSESPGYDPQAPPSDNLPSVEDRLSPSSVIVKDEPTDSDHIFPVSLHRHEMSNMSNRKRTAAEAIAGSHDGIVSESLSPGSSTTPKTRRVSPDADQDIHHTNSDPSTNQSLMSIISGDMDNHPTETVDLTESDINIIMEYENKEGISQPRDNSRPSFSSPPAAASGSSEYSTRGDDSFNTVPDLQDIQVSGTQPHVPGTEDVQFIQTGNVPRAEYIRDPYVGRTPGPREPQRLDDLWSGHWTHRNYPFELTSQGLRKRIVNLSQKSPQVIGNMVNVVGMLGRWLWHQHGESRLIEQIPAAELDNYLSTFFCVAKGSNGMDYGAHRLTCMRSNLERFLKESGYPFSIIKSVEFSKSQVAFKAKRKTVQNLR